MDKLDEIDEIYKLKSEIAILEINILKFDIDVLASKIDILEEIYKLKIEIVSSMLNITLLGKVSLRLCILVCTCSHLAGQRRYSNFSCRESMLKLIFISLNFEDIFFIRSFL